MPESVEHVVSWLSVVKQIITDYLPAVRDALLAIFQIASTWFKELIVAAVAALAVYDVVRRAREVPGFSHLLDARRAAGKIGAYVRTELGLLRSWPSLISAKYIDFSKDYVSLVLVEHMTGRFVNAKRSISVAELLASETPAAVVSGPGCGKTTLLLHMQYVLLTTRRSRLGVRRRSIPVFIRAREALSPESPLRSALVERLARAMSKDDAERLARLGLQRGWFTILLDGLDEIDSHAAQFIQEIKRFVDQFPNGHLILSSRPISFDLSSLTDEGPRSFKEIAIAPLSIDNKKALIKRYARDPLVATQIEEVIAQHVFLAQLTIIAMNLILLIESISFSDEIRNRADFYRHAAQILLLTMPRRKETLLRYSLDEKLQLLAQLSYELFINRRTFTTHTVNEVGRLPGGSGSAVFDEIRSTSGLIRLVTLERFDFPHRTFCEYFAAVHIGTMGSKLADTEWSKVLVERNVEIIAFLANLSDSIDGVVERLLSSSEKSPLILAACLAECRSITSQLQEKAEQVIWEYLRDSRELLVQSSVTRIILSKLHQFPRQKHFVTIFERLLDQLSYPSRYIPNEFPSVADVQTYALKYLVHTRSLLIVPRLVAILTSQESDIWIRFKAGELLSNLAREEYVRDLEHAYQENSIEKALQASSDDDVRRFVVEALVRTRSVDAVSVLRTATLDTDLVISDLAAEGIKYITAREYLEDATVVRISMAGGGEKEIVPGYDVTAAEALEIATDQKSRYRLDAFLKLREGCPENPGDSLASVALDQSENEYFRCEAVKLIGSQASANFAELLVRIFRARGDDPAKGAGARGYAIEYLAYRKRHEALDCILDCDVTWTRANERTKIFWSLNEILLDMDAEEIATRWQRVRQLCRIFENDPHRRLHHWRKKIEEQLAGRLSALSEPES